MSSDHHNLSAMCLSRLGTQSAEVQSNLSHATLEATSCAEAHIDCSNTANESLFIVSFDRDKDHNPRLWRNEKKFLVGSFVLLTSFTATLGTPIYVAATPLILRTFGLTLTEAILPSSLYALALGVGSLLASGFSEIYGRALVYYITLPPALLFTILGSTAPTFAYLAVLKMLAGLFSGPSLTVGVGILNDLWDPTLDPAGTLMAVLFVLVIIWATQIGPLASASIISTWGRWQWTFHVSSMLLILCVFATFVLPETYAPEIQRRLARQRNQFVMSRDISWKMVRKAVARPLHILWMERIVLPTALMLAVTQSVVFAYYVAYTVLFEAVYGFTEVQVGLAFLPLFVGSFFAIPIVGLCDRLLYQKARAKARRDGTMVAPEKRLYPAMLSSLTMPISLFWLAWTGKKEIHWTVPILSGGLFGFSYVLNMLCLPLYNNDIYTTRYGASVLAASTFLRFLISSFFLLLTPKLLTKIGFGWCVSILGSVMFFLMPIPWVFWEYGPRLRAGSQYLRGLETWSS